MLQTEVIEAEESEMIRDKIEKNYKQRKYVVRTCGIKGKVAINTEYAHNIIAKIVLWI